MLRRTFFSGFIFILVCLPAQAEQFKVGFAKVDITPEANIPMWGYGARHDALSKGVRDPLHAKGVVIDVGAGKLAIVGLDLGRSPDPEIMDRLLAKTRKEAGITAILMSGSHTHHGPVIELRNEDGKGKERFQDAAAYADDLEEKLGQVILDAAANVQDAKIGWASAEPHLNRNRHTKIQPKPTEKELAVVRFDDLDGKPIALLVNFAAHPTMLDGADLRFSSEYPGQMMNYVEKTLGTNCFFMQGAAGDLSPNRPEGVEGIEGFGKVLGDEVLAVNKKIETSIPENPQIQWASHEFVYQTRIDFRNPIVKTLFANAFFPELAECVYDLVQNNELKPRLTTVLLNGRLAMVGGSGEFFCQHSNRLKERSRAEKTLFFGYCNGHHMYFPTVEAAAEGGYGADSTVSWVSLGAGEEMMNQALIDIYTMLGKFTSPEM
ncbi:MAG: hypothetical protein KC994_12920 [Candidatus Omnitrophica bacterium]|nr:hypothetical protein [Candidatus Omnitrophota bacterium]